MYLKHRDDVQWRDLPKVESPFFARAWLGLPAKTERTNFLRKNSQIGGLTVTDPGLLRI